MSALPLRTDTAMFGAYERQQDANQRFEDAAERAAVKLSDELLRIRRLSEPSRTEAMVDLVMGLLNYDMDCSVFDGLIERLSEDTGDKPTALVMRWAGETEHLS